MRYVKLEGIVHLKDNSSLCCLSPVIFLICRVKSLKSLITKECHITNHDMSSLNIYIWLEIVFKGKMEQKLENGNYHPKFFYGKHLLCSKELRKLYNLDHFGDELFLQQQQNILLKKNNTGKKDR